MQIFKDDKYSNKFKEMVVKNYLDNKPKQTVNQVAIKFKVKPTTLRNWVKRHHQDISAEAQKKAQDLFFKIPVT